MPSPSGRSLPSHEICRLLADARARTLLLVAGVGDEDLTRQHSPLMSPIVWDLGHIAHFEEVWLLENLETGGEGKEGLRGIYDPFENPRSTRDGLALPSPGEALEYMARVRGAVLDGLDRIELDGSSPLLEQGFVFRMVLQHEYQHNETILQTLQLKRGAPYRPPRAVDLAPRAAEGAPPETGMVRFPGGEVELGTDERGAAYDNERPAHRVELEPFWIDVHPVTNASYLEFMEDGGYRRRELWSDEGWAWLREEEAEAPAYWGREGDGWTVRVMDRTGEVDPRHPVCHVCWHEARAYARWAGKRLPTEAEWEAAASWDPEAGAKRTYPWGEEPPEPSRANLDQLAFGTAPVGRHPRGASPVGCQEMLGDVWEWTSSPFRGYPGFRAFPYREYSEAFFGEDHRVLRGGSWATRPGAIRNTFRNWDFPIRRQIFAGFRCARDD